MRRSSLLFLIFAAIPILMLLALPPFFKSEATGTERISLNTELAAGSSITAITTDFPEINLKVSYDPDIPSPIIESGDTGLKCEYIDSTSTLIIHSGSSAYNYSEVHVTLPEQSLEKISGISGGSLALSNIHAQELSVIPSPSNIAMGQTNIGTLILGELPDDKGPINLTAGNTSIGALISAVPQERINMTFGQSHIGTIRSAGEDD
ncbi:MAG: hypothetical protein HDR92_00585 [Bacteroides sp.]|nr:hypothetical protein [Bacteroides sp.]